MQQHAETESGDAKEREAARAKAQTKTFLFLGLDRRAQTADIGRTDVILLAVVNGKKEQVTLLSLPRDTYVEIAGQGYKDKVNHSYQYGVATTIATVESFTGGRVVHYVEFDFAGVQKGGDAVVHRRSFPGVGAIAASRRGSMRASSAPASPVPQTKRKTVR